MKAIFWQLKSNLKTKEINLNERYVEEHYGMCLPDYKEEQKYHFKTLDDAVNYIESVSGKKYKSKSFKWTPPISGFCYTDIYHIVEA